MDIHTHAHTEQNTGKTDRLLYTSVNVRVNQYIHMMTTVTVIIIRQFFYFFFFGDMTNNRSGEKNEKIVYFHQRCYRYFYFVDKLTAVAAAAYD